MPRSEVVSAGTPMSQLPESAITMTSAAISSRCSASSRSSESEPYSSSPSMKSDHADRQRVAEGAQRGDVRHDAGLVVGGAAAVEPAVALDRLERVALPQRQVADRLHVVVGVEQHGRRAGRGRLAADHRRLPAGAHDPDVEAAAAQQFGDRLGGALDVRVVEAVEGDAGDADEAFQVGADAGQFALDGGAQLGLGQVGCGHAGPYRSGHAACPYVRRRGLAGPAASARCRWPGRLPGVPRPRAGPAGAPPAQAPRSVAPSPRRRSSPTSGSWERAERLPVGLGRRLDLLGDARRRRRRRAADSRRRAPRPYPPESIQWRRSAARATGTGWVLPRGHPDLVQAVAQVAAAVVLGGLLQEGRGVDLADRSPPPASFISSRSAAAGSCPASRPARSAESSALRHHSSIAAMMRAQRDRADRQPAQVGRPAG